jgi:hypothetical protein
LVAQSAASIKTLVNHGIAKLLTFTAMMQVECVYRQVDLLSQLLSVGREPVTVSLQRLSSDVNVDVTVYEKLID